MRNDGSGIRASVWLYTKLLALYPISFQARYGREMRLTFRDVSRQENGLHGPGGLIGLWFEVFADLVSTALQEHLREVRMLTQRQSFIRLAGAAGIIGGVLGIVVGLAFMGDFTEDPGTVEMALWVLAYLLIAVGAMGLFTAGRHEKEINGMLGMMLLGALATALAAFLMVADIGAGWFLWPVGMAVHGGGLFMLGLVARKNQGFMRLDWLPTALGIAALALVVMVAVMSNQSQAASEQLFGIFHLALGAGWAMLGLLLASGNVRTDARPPSVA